MRVFQLKEKAYKDLIIISFLPSVVKFLRNHMFTENVTCILLE